MNAAGIYENLAFAAVIVVIGVYVLRMKSLIGRIERVHPATWEELGRPTMQPPRMRDALEFLSASWRTFAFAVFAGRYKRLEDPQLTRIVWSVRVLVVIGALLLLAIAIVDPDGPWPALHR